MAGPARQTNQQTLVATAKYMRYASHMGIIDRFTGDNAERNVLAALVEQQLVMHSGDIAADLMAVGAVQHFKIGDVLIQQGDYTDDIFFIFAGDAAIAVNDHVVNSRSKGEAVGEMAAADVGSNRMATVTAMTEIVAFRVSAPDFNAVADKHLVLWRKLTKVVCDRLRSYQRHFRPKNAEPVLFIGSSAEGLDIANQIQLGLKHEKVTVRVWTNRVFGPGGSSVDNLLEQSRQADFAAFVFGQDDMVASRKESHLAPRDNVVFELGMFISVLGRERALIVMEHNADLKMPTDLLGITPISYKIKGGDIPASLATVCTELGSVIRRLGPL